MLKNLSLHVAMFACKIMLNLHGWRTSPRPPGYAQRPNMPYWRFIKVNQIASATFAEAITQTVRASKKRP